MRKLVKNSPTVGEILNYYSKDYLNPQSSCPKWPPDLFALMSIILELSGSYLDALSNWPPAGLQNEYSTEIERMAKEWRDSIDSFERIWTHLPHPPKPVSRLWRKLLQEHFDQELTKLNGSICLQLMSIADAACLTLLQPGKGLPGFSYYAQLRMIENMQADKISSLGSRVSPHRAVILPKRRTPQTGLNIRSLSLNIGAVRSSEIRPHWYADILKADVEDGPSRNLLLIPWPLSVSAEDFVPVVPVAGDMETMDFDKFGYFTLANRIDATKAVKIIMSLYRRAIEEDKVDAIVFPEGALNDEVLRLLRKDLNLLGSPPSLLAGVAREAVSGEKQGSNEMVFVPSEWAEEEADLVIRQKKHHRWQVERSQIHQYGLGTTLNPQKIWWEYIPLAGRKLSFLQFAPWLTVAPLICEDLARPDPVGDLLRAFGPDLIIALLMDGPQLTHRWAARNAMTLADDPGSAVLCFTSAGMVDRSNLRQNNARRVVALYKDPTTPAKEIELPNGAEAIVLTLTRNPRQEWAADGRCSSPEQDFHPVLSKIRYIQGSN